MSDALDTKLSFAVAIAVAMYWALALAIPFLILDRAGRSDVQMWVIFAAFAGYFIYTGYRAWKRGWKARFVLRIVIPAGLFLCGWVAVGLITWLD